MNTHQQSCPLSGCEWCHCQLPHVALTAPNHTSCVAGTSHSTLQQHRFFYLSITVSGWYFPRGVVVHQDGGPVTVFTCGPSTSFWYHTNMTGSSLSISLFLFFFFSPLHFSSAPSYWPGISYWPCIDNATTRFKQKPQVFLPSPFFRKCDQYIVQQKLLPQRQEYVNFCFTLSVFGKNFK